MKICLRFIIICNHAQIQYIISTLKEFLQYFTYPKIFSISRWIESTTKKCWQINFIISFDWLSKLYFCVSLYTVFHSLIVRFCMLVNYIETNSMLMAHWQKKVIKRLKTASFCPCFCQDTVCLAFLLSPPFIGWDELNIKRLTLIPTDFGFSFLWKH